MGSWARSLCNRQKPETRQDAASWKVRSPAKSGELAEEPLRIEVCMPCAAVNQPRAQGSPNRSERPDDHQHHDQRRGDAGNLVDHAHRLTGKRALAPAQLLAVAAEPALIAGERHDERELRAEPILAERPDVEGEHESQDPDNHHRRGEDDRPDPRLALDPGAVLGGPDRRFLVIDVEARQQEQPRHPEDDEGDVRGLDPKISRGKEAGEFDHARRVTRVSICSTCSIGVSCKMP